MFNSNGISSSSTTVLRVNESCISDNIHRISSEILQKIQEITDMRTCREFSENATFMYDSQGMGATHIGRMKYTKVASEITRAVNMALDNGFIELSGSDKQGWSIICLSRPYNLSEDMSHISFAFEIRGEREILMDGVLTRFKRYFNGLWENRGDDDER